MRKMTKLMLAMAVPVAVLAGGNANAGTMITDWNYENLFGFSAYSPAAPLPNGVEATNNNTLTNFSIGSLDANPALNDPTKLYWGSATAQSSFVLSGNTGNFGQTLGAVQTNGLDAFDLKLTHNNFPIPLEATTLKSATLVGSLMLQSALPVPLSGIPIGPLTGHFKILFKETNNNPGSGLCADGKPMPCPDIFVLDVAGSSPLTDVFLATIDNWNYFLSVNVSGLQSVGPEECASVVPAQPAGCLGFVTKENQATDLILSFNIKAVPEPGTLALLGLGLAGLGFGRIRRRK